MKIPHDKKKVNSFVIFVQNPQMCVWHSTQKAWKWRDVCHPNVQFAPNLAERNIVISIENILMFSSNTATDNQMEIPEL